MNELELLRTVCRYVLAMYRRQCYRELKTRLEVLLELLDMAEEKKTEFMISDIVETVCFISEEEPNASDV